MNWFPVLLIAHVALAISLLAPSLLLPFLLRRERPTGGPGGLTRALMAMQGTGSVVIGLGLAATGVGLVLSLGTRVLSQPWLLVALTRLCRQPADRRVHLAAEPAPADAGVDPDAEAWRTTRAATAIHRLRDGGSDRGDRIPDEHQAGALVGPRTAASGSAAASRE